MTIQGQSLKSQKEEKRIRMIQAAYELFSEKGVYKTSIDDIAKSAGVAKGTFYLYFADKTEIWEAVVVDISNRILPDMIERILFVADFIIEHFKKNLDDLKIVQRNFSWPLVLRKMNEAQDNTLLQMLEQCFCSPYLSRYTIEEAYRMMFLIVEMVGSICYTSILLEQPAPIDQMKPVLFHTIRKILI